jgi:hypothetical protein
MGFLRIAQASWEGWAAHVGGVRQGAAVPLKVP